MSKFQLTIITVLSGAALIALLMFAGILPGFGDKKGNIETEVSLWGPFPETKLRNFFTEFNDENRESITIKYFEKDPETYKTELVNAMASGNPPDMWFMSQDMVWEFKDKAQKISFESFAERNFKDMFADSADLFIDSLPAQAGAEGEIIGFPYIMDPIVLYWNRDIFSSSGVARAPAYWDEFLSASTAITKIDNAGNITRSGAALGEFRNVKNAKEILSMMILQTGNQIAQVSDRGKLELLWGKRTGTGLSAAESSLRFFNEFSNPQKTSYSWNRSLSHSDSAFAGGSLAMYFGHASEFENVKKKNPHLNFDVATVPQIRDSSLSATYGKIYSLAVSKISPGRQAAVAAIYKLINKDLNAKFAEKLLLAPAMRDALAAGHSNPALSIFYKSAVMAKSWLEPNPQAVSAVFKNMIESTATGKVRISEAVNAAKRQIEEMANQGL